MSAGPGIHRCLHCTAAEWSQLGGLGLKLCKAHNVADVGGPQTWYSRDSVFMETLISTVNIVTTYRILTVTTSWLAWQLNTWCLHGFRFEALNAKANTGTSVSSYRGSGTWHAGMW